MEVFNSAILGSVWSLERMASRSEARRTAVVGKLCSSLGMRPAGMHRLETVLRIFLNALSPACTSVGGSRLEKKLSDIVVKVSQSALRKLVKVLFSALM